MEIIYCKIYLTFYNIYYTICNVGGDAFLKNKMMKIARIECDLSQEQLAEKVGVTRQTIIAIESGNYNPTLNLCIAICKALNKSLNELFWEE